MNARIVALVQTMLTAALLAFGAGCGSSLASTPTFSAPSSGSVLARTADAPLPKGDTAWNKEARADHLVGSIAASLGVLQHQMDEARTRRDVVKLNCVNAKFGELTGIERNARDRRAAIRSASLEDSDADGPYGQLTSYEARARQLRSDAMQCVGQEVAFRGGQTTTTEDVDGVADRDYDGIPDETDKMPEMLDRSKARTEVSLSGKAVTGAAQAAITKQHDPSMIIHTAEIALAVYEVSKNLQTVEKFASELGGYLALRSDREITVRVPRDKFDELVSRIEKMGDVLHKNIAAEDVTDQYVDLDMRLRNATAVRERLEKLLVAATVRDAVEIHKELSKVTEEIERFEGKLKLLRDRIAYSTTTVTFEQQQQQQVHSQALLPFPWMGTMGLSPLLRVPR
jgi:hypothetical protein